MPEDLSGRRADLFSYCDHNPEYPTSRFSNSSSVPLNRKAGVTERETAMSSDMLAKEKRKLLPDLELRVKELTALRTASSILLGEWKDTSAVLAQLVAIVPPASRWPARTAARIRLGLNEAATPNFGTATSILRAEFTTADRQPGSVEIGTADGCQPAAGGNSLAGAPPVWADGPSPSAENSLVHSLGDMLRTAYDRKLAEEKQRTHGQPFRALIESSSDAIALFGPDGVIVYASPSTSQVLGFTAEELTKLNVFEMIHPDHKAVMAKHVSELVKCAGGCVTIETRVRHKDGSWRWLEGTLRNLLEEASVGAIVKNYRDITGRKHAEDQLRGTSEDLRALSENILSAREQEGARIAREIHDELGSALTSLKWDLEGIDKAISTSSDQFQLLPLRKRIEEMTKLMDTTINVVRRIASDLRPSVLDDLGLGEALEWQAQQFQERTGINCICDGSLHDLNLTDEQATAVFRIFQEALTNILRHAHATHVRFVMQEDEGEFRLTITDNGRGITHEEKSGQRSLGLLGMRERAYLIGGTVDIAGTKGTGTVVTIRVRSAGSRQRMTRHSSAELTLKH
jgi:PAS domain S-box-containing protein